MVSASSSELKLCCRLPMIAARYSRVRTLYDNRMVCEVRMARSSNQYQRGRVISISVVKYSGMPRMMASSSPRFKSNANVADSLKTTTKGSIGAGGGAGPAAAAAGGRAGAGEGSGAGGGQPGAK